MFGSDWRNWWFGENSVVGKAGDKLGDLGEAEWWFGENSFWATLDVKSINYKGFGMTFGGKNSLMNYLPLALIGLITFKIFK